MDFVLTIKKVESMKLKLLTAAVLCSASFAANAADLPKACEDYFTAVEEFGKKYPQVADTYKQMVETTKQQLNSTPDKSMLAPGCEQALESFKQSTANM
ncbi:hypothetical protein AAEX37_01204 [Oligella sp. MSHR50489EDL]